MQSLKDRLKQDLTAAMRARDEVAKATLRMLLTTIANAEVSGKQQIELNDDQVMGLVRSELGKRTEAAEIYQTAGRTELEAIERAEANVLTVYLPPQLSSEVLDGIVAEEVARVAAEGIQGARAMGAVIKGVRERVGAQAEGSKISALVKAALNV